MTEWINYPCLPWERVQGVIKVLTCLPEIYAAHGALKSLTILQEVYPATTTVWQNPKFGLN